MKKIIFIFLALCAAMSASAQTPDRVKVGDKVPQFTVTMVDGTTVNIADLRGKVVLLNFWATWCPPCRAEFKRVPQEIVERFKGEDFVFLPISRGEDKATVEAFLKKEGYTFAAGLDPDQKIFKLFAEKSIPRNFLIDRKGVVVESEMGYSPELFDHLVKSIDKTIKSK